MERTTEPMDPESERMEAFIDTARHNLMTRLNGVGDIVPYDNLGHAHDTNQVVSPQAEVCTSQKTMTSNDYTHDTPTELSHSISSITDPGGEVDAGPKGPSNGTPTMKLIMRYPLKPPDT